MSSNNSQYRDAVRLLFIMSEAGEACDPPPFDSAIALIDSKTRLQKLDFLMRYPDYFAHELLDRFEKNNDINLLNLAKEILNSEEPEIRTIDMTRYLYGAYEPIDDAISILNMYELARDEYEDSQTKYYLLEKGVEVAKDMARNVEGAQWYKNRAQHVGEFARGLSGSQLKALQYEHQEYANTQKGHLIPRITDEVRQRLTSLLKSGDENE